jgi:protein-tyrosine phosphatase
MMEIAAASGTTDIVATPHADLTYSFHPESIFQKVEELRRATNGHPRLYEGCDLHLTYDNIQDAITHPSKYSINHKCYLLVEFSDLLIFQNAAEIFERMRSAGLIPVITHPERNALLQQRIAHLEGWVADGCCLQITAQSFLGHFGGPAKEFSVQLLKKNMVHFVASDAHDPRHRPPVLKDAYDWVAKRYGEGLAERLFVDNPRAALAGQPLAPNDPAELIRVRKWYKLW